MLVTCHGRQGSGVCIGQRHISFIGLRQVGVTAELLFLRQLEGDRDHTKLSNNTSEDTQLRYLNTPSLAAFSPLPLLIFSPLSNRLPPAKALSHPFAVQRVRPLSFLCDEDHAAPLLLLFTLPQFDLRVGHSHHNLLRSTRAHAAAGALKGPGGRRLGGEVPGRRQEQIKGVKC